MSVMGLLSDVVARLIRQGYPETVADRIASGELPMDTASRMERARQLGFDPDDVQYHGTSDDILAFRDTLLAQRDPGYVGRGVYTTSEPRLASSYANMAVPRERNAAGDFSGPNVMPLLTRGDEFQQFSLQDKINLAEEIRQNPLAANALTEQLSDAGKAGAEVRDATGALIERATFDPRNVRSLLSAAFDPEYTGSNILGGAALPAIGGLLAAGQSGDADASIAALARRGLKVIKNGDDYDLIDEATGDYAGKMTTEELTNGNLWSADTELRAPYRRQGIGNEYYDAVEELSGKKMQPSPFLSRDGLRFWGRRDPEALANMVRNEEFYDGQNYEKALNYLIDIEYPGFTDTSNVMMPMLGATAAGTAGLLAAPEEAEAGVVSKAFGRAFDQRFDPRKKEQERLSEARFEIEERPGQDAPVLSLADLEGRPFVTSMSDRTQAGGLLTKIGDTELDRPVNLQGGQGFMFENPGMVWASAQGPVNQIVNAARAAGEDPLFLPFRMAPSGGDFATMTGEAMLSFASSNMNKKQKRALDRAIKNFKSTGSMVQGRRVNEGLQIQGWKGVDDPSAPAVWRSTPDALRKELMNMMDVRFRDQGGLSIGEARLAVTDPGQANAADAQIQNVGRIFTDKDVIERSGHFSYPRGVPGEGIGRIDQPVGIFELMPEARVGGAQRTVADPATPTAQEVRALQMKPYTGRITEDTLKRLQERGVEVGSADPRLLGAMGLGTAGILGAIAAGDRDDTAMAVAPRSDTLQDITMGLRGLERRLEGSPAALLFPEGVVNYLETVNRPYEDPTALTRAMALLDFL